MAPRESFVGRTWVTRSGVHVDRIASAWLIQRFIDAAARFKFVAPKGYVPEPGELRFDKWDSFLLDREERAGTEDQRGRSLSAFTNHVTGTWRLPR